MLEIPISSKTLSSVSVIIVVDLSKPQNVVESLLKWIKATREVIAKRMGELKATNNLAARAMKDAARAQYADNSDKARVKPSDVPVFIVATKWDTLRSKGVSSADKRSILQALRFIAHYSGASLFCTSVTDSSLKEVFRGIMGSICFRTFTKPLSEISLDKPLYISVGCDNFESILLGAKPGEPASAAPLSDSKSLRLVRSAAEIAEFITADGLTKACWSKFKDFFVEVFGAPDMKGHSSAGEAGVDTDAPMADNEFPESEIDAVRAERDIQLQRYIQEADRKESLLRKMYAGIPGDGRGDSVEDGKDDQVAGSSASFSMQQAVATGGETFEESKGSGGRGGAGRRK